MDLSIVIPTYNERENIQKLVYEVLLVYKINKINGEIIVVDDNSEDGTGRVVEDLKKKYKNLQVIHRKGKMGLSSAVLDGFKIARGHILGVMDADLSHPPEKISEMWETIKNDKTDLAIGSRYTEGGRIYGWGISRNILSKSATLLARIFTKVNDPMTGFFMIKKECLKGKKLNPKGFKILLEILIKSDYKKVKEIPITFVNRVEGKSKAGTKEIIYFLQNLYGYLFYKKRVVHEFFKFAFVGFIGTLINLAVLYGFTEFFGVYYIFSAVFAFLIAATNNFLFNKFWTFNEKSIIGIIKKYFLFFSVSLTALSVNLLFLYILTDGLGIYYIFSQMIAISIALVINFIGNKIWVFN